MHALLTFGKEGDNMPTSERVLSNGSRAFIRHIKATINFCTLLSPSRTGGGDIMISSITIRFTFLTQYYKNKNTCKLEWFQVVKGSIS